MSYHLEQDLEELDPLVGASIFRIARVEEDGQEFIRLYLRLRSDIAVNGSVLACYDVWQDVEGNGPGYLAYCGGTEFITQERGVVEAVTA